MNTKFWGRDSDELHGGGDNDYNASDIQTAHYPPSHILLASYSLLSSYDYSYNILINTHVLIVLAVIVVVEVDDVLCRAGFPLHFVSFHSI